MDISRGIVHQRGFHAWYGEKLQRDGDTMRAQFLSKRFCLLYRHVCVLRTVEQKHWYRNLVSMIHGRPVSHGSR